MELNSASRCVAIREIASIIVQDAFNEGQGGSGNYATVAALACTSWFFTDVALDRLWHTQMSIHNLVETLPEDAISWAPAQDGIVGAYLDSNLVISRPLLPDDWKRFESYAKRIKILDTNLSPTFRGRPPTFRLKPAVYHSLALYRVSLTLLPNLHTLYWDYRGVGQNAYQFAPLLLNPNISFLELIGGPKVEYTPAWIVLQAAHTAKHLRHLELNGAGGAASTIQAAFPLLTDLATLNMRGRWSTLEPMFEQLSLLTSLKKLVIAMPPQDPRHKTLVPSASLESLAEFVLEGHTDIVIAILCASRIPTLHTLKVTFYDQRGISNTTLRRLCLTVPQSCGHRSLRSISIVPKHLKLGRPSETSILNAIEPLFQFSDLRHIYVRLENHIRLNDSDMQQMAAAWPSLETLSLNDGQGLTLNCLQYLVIQFPALRCLNVPLKECLLGLTPRKRPGGGHTNKHITRLDVQCEEGTHQTTAIAAFLHDLFPNLSSIGAISEQNLSDKALEESIRTLRIVESWR